VGKRIGAVLVAVALIAGALLLRRNVLDDDDEVVTGATTPATEPAADAGELLCITELRDVCTGLGDEFPELRVTVQDAGATLDALANLPDDGPRPVWLTIEPFPEMLDSLRTANRLAPFGATAEVVGASRLIAATTPPRSTELATACADQPLWRCIGANAGNDWTTLNADAEGGVIRPSLGVVERQAIALASLAVAVSGYFGTADIRSSDWQSDPSFTPWFSRLSGAVAASALSAGTPLATMTVRPPLDIAAATDAELAALGGERFVANYPEPSMWVEAVVAVPERTAVPDGLAAALTDAMATAGWDDPGAVTQALPSATTMLALRALWQEST
jgi:hypothetical protein